MAYEESLRSITLLADASIGVYTGPPGAPGSADPNTGKMYRFVKMTGASTVGLTTTKATDRKVGVLQNKPQATGAAATVGIRGVTNVIAGENDLTAGDLITTDGEGRAIAVTSTEQVYGIAITGSTAVGQTISVLLV